MNETPLHEYGWNTKGVTEGNDMMNADEMRKATAIDAEMVNRLVSNTYAGMQAAAEKGMHHFSAWVYDTFDHRWLGDLPDAVVEEAERQFREAGYEFGWEGKNGYASRVIKW